MDVGIIADMSRSVRWLAWINALLAAVVALLGMAPFTPALVTFAGIVPAAWFLAKRGAHWQGLVVVALLVAALLAAPGWDHQTPFQWPAIVWLIWTFGFAACVLRAWLARK